MLCMQLATIAGSLDVPNWYESGKVFANQHPEIPQRARLASAADGLCRFARVHLLVQPDRKSSHPVTLQRGSCA